MSAKIRNNIHTGTLGTRLDFLPSEALADTTKLRQVAKALSLHGVISLAPEQGITPSTLAGFTIGLATERNKNNIPGRLVKGVDDLANAACPNVRIGDAPHAPLAEENVALVLSNVPLSDAAAFGVDPMYIGPGRIPETDSSSNGGNSTCKRAGVDANLAAVWHHRMNNSDDYRPRSLSCTVFYHPGTAMTQFMRILELPLRHCPTHSGHG
jgi:hypothetical protein